MNIIVDGFKSLIEFGVSITGDFGMAIVLLTLLVKFVVMPLSIKQKISLRKQQEVSKKIEGVNSKYKNNSKKKEKELADLYKESSKGMLGCLMSLVQIPIISALYLSIKGIEIDAITYLVPWVANIKLPDSYYIIPIIYTLISVAPNLLQSFKAFGSEEQPATLKMIIPMMIFSLIITVKSPIAIGIYFITSSLYNLIEEIALKIYFKKKALSI